MQLMTLKQAREIVRDCGGFVDMTDLAVSLDAGLYTPRQLQALLVMVLSRDDGDAVGGYRLPHRQATPPDDGDAFALGRWFAMQMRESLASAPVPPVDVARFWAGVMSTLFGFCCGACGPDVARLMARQLSELFPEKMP